MTTFETVGPAPVSELAVEARVRTRDGVHLATDVYLPGGDTTPGDTILIRLPYDKSGEYTFIPVVAEYFMRSGYRVVAQDVRGKFRSEGQTLLFVHEVNDGYDTIDWITKQEWSNGRVAMWGDSYYGYTQWAAASSGHPALKAISPRVTGTGLGNPVRRAAGEKHTRVEMGVTLLYPLSNFHTNDSFEWEPTWTRPYAADAEEFISSVGVRSDSYDLWYPKPVTLNRFPQGQVWDAPAVPTLHTIGWWDNCGPLSWDDVRAITSNPAWDTQHHLRIEAIDHENHFVDEPESEHVFMRSSEQLEAIMPAMLGPTLEFFDVYVRGNGKATDIPRVTWELARTGTFETCENWPPAHERVSLDLTADGLIQRDPATEGELSWVHDPDHPVPSPVEDAFAFLMTHPDEAPLGARDDVLVFDAPAVEADVDLIGDVSAQLGFVSSGPVADVFLRLLDVSPSGEAFRISRGQRRVYDATEETRVDVPMDPLGYRLRAGHHLRLHVSSSDAPEFVPLPGTDEDPWAAVETVKTTQTVRFGGDSPFVLTLGRREVAEGDNR
ncbi:CocE/NonD family hydrolase [Galactobacter sp.]|uniref:CocE/NonD family hydrolase n=1 Tax=Galactobacter sp. TaxID=2676125 RepID=UPI0025C6BFD4|nr:CocE/NonD family hydrolase [Galactobacter sp.]